MVEGHIVERVFGKRTAGVVLLTYDRARIVIGPTETCWYDDNW